MFVVQLVPPSDDDLKPLVTYYETIYRTMSKELIFFFHTCHKIILARGRMFSFKPNILFYGGFGEDCPKVSPLFTHWTIQQQ